MIPEDIQTLLEAARWTRNYQNRRQTLRQLARAEEHHLLLVRELDRVEGQRLRAHALRAEATLTLVEWLETLNAFQWRCAYCQAKPFQIMSHTIPLPEGGTTVTNGVPACYRCLQCRRRNPPGEAQRGTWQNGMVT
jgi:hypothetical protein